MSILFSRFLEDQTIIRHPENPKNPLVSIVMPTYKLRGEMNRRAIDSVLGQTFRDFELIMVDDGSLDGLSTLLNTYQQQDSRIILVRHEINSGLPALRTDEGILLSRGKYIAYMFEDDYWLPDALENLVSTAEKENRECLVYGETEFLIHTEDSAVTRTLGAWDFNYGDLKHHNWLANCAVLHPRSAMNLCGMYDPNILIRRLSDYDLWLRMGKMIPFVRCHHVVGMVESGTKYALGTSVDADVALSYRYMGTHRSDFLHPDRICQYEVDRLPFETTAEDAYRIREHYIIPFLTQHPALLTPSERRLAIVSRRHPNRVLITKGAYATSIDVTLGNLAEILPSSIQSQTFFPEEFLSLVKLNNFDTVVCHKALDGASLVLQERARVRGQTNIYLLDDNLFKSGTGYMAETFPYLRPGEARYSNLIHEVSVADMVFSYSQKITEDSKAYNPRVVELSNTIREKYILDKEPLPGGKSTGRRIKYALLTGPVRKRELQVLWEQFARFFANHKDEVEFHVWGINPAEFGALDCQVYMRGFENAYEKYLDALSNEKFDFMICPLFDDHEVKISKTPIKYMEGTAAGAVGIFSEAVIYRDIIDGLTGLKTNNDHWTEALERSYQMTDAERNAIYACAKKHVLDSCTTESQVINYLTAFEAADLHNQLHSYDTPNGKAKIAYFFHETILGGATLHLLKHALFAKRYGFEPVICFMTRKPLDPGMLKLLEDNQLSFVQLDFYTYTWFWYNNFESVKRAESILTWMKENDIRMVHLVTYSAEVIYAASRANIPLVMTLHAYYETPDKFLRTDESMLVEQPRICAIHSSSLRYAWKWESVLDAPGFCIRAPISDTYFGEYEKRSQKSLPQEPTLLIAGTLQPRKRQLEAVQAVKLLKKEGINVRLVLLGYDNLKADYVAECREEIYRAGLQDQVEIPGFALDPKSYYDQADFLICPSDVESMPQSILKAMASGMRVITTPVGGVKELVLDGFSGIVTDGYEPEDLANAIRRALSLSDETWGKILENAHHTAQMTCSEEVVRYQLFKLYNVGIQEHKRLGGVAVPGDDSVRQTRLLFQIQSSGKRSYDPEEEIYARRMTVLGLTYRVRIPNDSWNAIILSFGTYLRSFNDKLEVTIRKASFPFSILRRVEVDGASLPDNDPYTISFTPIMNVAGKDVLVHVRAKSGQFRPLLSVYEKGRRINGFRRYLRLMDGRGGKLFGNLVFAPPVVSKDETQKTNGQEQSK